MFRLPLSLRCHQEVGSLRFSWRLLTTGNSSQSSHKNNDGNESTTEKLQQSEETVSSTQADSMTANQGAEDGENVKKAATKAKLANLLSSLQKDTQRSKRSLPVVELSRPRYQREQLEQRKLTDEEKELKEGYKSVGQQFTEAIKSVSEEVGGGSTTQSELLTSLKKWKSGDDLGDASPAANMKDLLSGMTAEKRAPRSRERVGLSDRSFPSSQPMQITGLFDAEPLNIFPAPPPVPEAPSSLLPTWDALAARDLEQSIARPPANQYQEFIQWTDQGKIWTFPIDNEVGLEEEKSVPFHEHIFLERYIASWCPRSGPVAHFMELVCVGLSKNPHVPVQRKHAVLDWYREYFDEKRSLLEELGAIPKDAIQADKSMDETTS